MILFYQTPSSPLPSDIHSRPQVGARTAAVQAGTSIRTTVFLGGKVIPSLHSYALSLLIQTKKISAVKTDNRDIVRRLVETTLVTRSRSRLQLTA